jgi:hypothetical protein
MSYIPSFFTKLDFWVLLLPGYISLIVGLFLLQPEIFNTSLTTAQEPTLFLIVVFIVAGPAIGLMMWQLYIQVASVGLSMVGHADMKYEFLREYSRLKTCCTDKEKAEIDVTESQYQFGISTGIALLIVASLYLILYVLEPMGHDTQPTIFHIDPKQPKYRTAEILLVILIFVFPILLMYGARVYNRRVRLPLICGLMAAYTGEVCSTEVCRRTRAERSKSRRKRAKKMYKRAKEKIIKIKNREQNMINERLVKQIREEVFHYLEESFTIDKDFVKEEIHTDEKMEAWSLKFFEALDWLSSLINREEKIEKKDSTIYLRHSIVNWYNKIFLELARDGGKIDSSSYPELKKLVEQYNKQNA